MDRPPRTHTCFVLRVAAGQALRPDLRSAPKHSGSRLHGRDDWEESLLATSHCANGTPAGLSQGGMADLKARRRGRAASEHQFVHEIVALEDSSVDVSVVLQNSRFVPRAFRFCYCLEERGRCPAGVVHAEKTPKASGTLPVLEHSGWRGGFCLRYRSHCGCARCRIPPDLRVRLAFTCQLHSPNSCNLHLNLSFEKKQSDIRKKK